MTSRLARRGDHSGADLVRHLMLGGAPRNTHHDGTKALMLAVLEEGLRCYFGPRGHRHREAETWIWSKNTSAFSFITICETLDVQPHVVRQALPRLKDECAAPYRLRPDAHLGRNMKLAVRARR